MKRRASIEIRPIVRRHSESEHDLHPLWRNRDLKARVVDLREAPDEFPVTWVGVSVDGTPRTLCVGAQYGPDRGIVDLARALLEAGERYVFDPNPIELEWSRDEALAPWTRGTTYTSLLGECVPELLSLADPVPSWIHRLVIYLLLEAGQADREHDCPSSRLTHTERAEVAKLLRTCIERLPLEEIEAYRATPVAPNRRAALLSAAGAPLPAPTWMADNDFLPARRVSSFHSPGSEPQDRWWVDGQEVMPAHVKIIDHSYFDQVFVHERVTWLPRGEVEFERDGVRDAVKTNRRQPAASAKRTPRQRVVRAIAWRWGRLSRKLRALPGVKGRPSVQRGESVLPVDRADHPTWLYMDRHDSAGDNAEPLYRYAVPALPGVRHVFAIEKSSPDWLRLEADGFELVDIDSPDFDVEWKRARAILLADIGDPKCAPRLIGQGTRRDQGVIFLQHGVTMREMWRWMNGKRFDVLVTATEVEHHAIVEDHSSYTITEPQVWFTGFPRHDLLFPLLGRERDRIVLAPTWKVPLAHGLEENPDDFSDLDAAYAPWLAVAESLKVRGFEPVLFVHPKIALLAPEWSESLPVSTTTGRDVPEQLSRAIATVSDRSSILDDAMLLGGAGLVWDPTGTPDTDRYRRMHFAAGARYAADSGELLALIRDIADGSIDARSAVSIPDACARERLVARLLEAGFGPRSDAWRPRMFGRVRVSLIVAVYGVQKYLPNFFASLEAQDYPHDLFEVVLVCDGANDDSPRLCRQWAEGTDIAVTIIEQDNSGQASARNRGLRSATGEWVGFPDPDDSLSSDFLTEMLAARDLRSPLLVSRMIIRKDGEKRDHPLDFRFAGGTRMLDAQVHSHYIQLATNCCLIEKRALDALGPDPFPEDRGAPTFEDAMLIGRLRSHDTRMIVVPTAEYYYEKRSEGSSTVQGAWAKPGRYVDQIRTRYIPYLEAAAQAPWAQQTVLYDLGWYFISTDEHPLSPEVHEVWTEHLALLDDLLTRIDAEEILRAPWPHLTADARARLFLIKGEADVAIIDKGEVLRLYLRNEAAYAGAAESACYGPTSVGRVIRGEAAREFRRLGSIRVPIWPRKPRLYP